MFLLLLLIVSGTSTPFPVFLRFAPFLPGNYRIDVTSNQYPKEQSIWIDFYDYFSHVAYIQITDHLSDEPAVKDSHNQ